MNTSLELNQVCKQIKKIKQDILDKKETQALVERLICDDYVTVKNNLLRHDVLKLGMHIFGYLLEEGKGDFT